MKKTQAVNQTTHIRVKIVQFPDTHSIALYFFVSSKCLGTLVHINFGLTIHLFSTQKS